MPDGFTMKAVRFDHFPTDAELLEHGSPDSIDNTYDDVWVVIWLVPDGR